MGNRRNIRLVYSDGNEIFLYTHWGAYQMPHQLRDVLARRERWDDEAYLARMIFSRIVKDDVDGESGFGIAPYEIDPENPTITVFLESQEIEYKEKTFSFDEWVKYIRRPGEKADGA